MALTRAKLEEMVASGGITLQTDTVNVMSFGATGDGTTDDTQAIQDAIDFAETNGGEVYFPEGVYALETALHTPSVPGTASALMMYDNMTLRFAPGATLKRTNANVTHMIYTYNASGATGYTGCQNIQIIGATIDCNSALGGSVTPINTSHTTRAVIRDCTFVDGIAWHYIEINSSKDVEVSGCVFTGTLTGENVQIDAAVATGNIGADDGTVCTDIRIFNNVFNMDGQQAIGNHTNAANYNIRIFNNTFNGGGHATEGYIHFVALTYNVDIYDNAFNGGAAGITLANTTTNSTVRGNRFTSVTAPFSGGIIAVDNIINGAKLVQLLSTATMTDATTYNLSNSYKLYERIMVAIKNTETPVRTQLVEIPVSIISSGLAFVCSCDYKNIYRLECILCFESNTTVKCYGSYATGWTLGGVVIYGIA